MADPRIGRSRIPEHLRRINMSQVDYARRIKVSASFVSKVIAGEKQLSLVKSKMSADLFECYIDDLNDWEY